MTAHVSAVVGREVALWSTIFGAPLGTMTYTVRVEGIADLQAVSAQILGDAEYHAKLAKGVDYAVGNAEDRLFQPLNAELGDPPPVGSMALVTSAVMAAGAYEKAIAWGLDMAQHASSVTGIPTLFLVEQYGIVRIGRVDRCRRRRGGGRRRWPRRSTAMPTTSRSSARPAICSWTGSGHRILSTRVA